MTIDNAKSHSQLTPAGLSEGEKLVTRYIEEVINNGDIDVVDEIYAEDYVNHTIVTKSGDEADSSGFYGRERVKEVVRQWRIAFPDVHVTIDDMFQGDDRLACRVTVRGTHDGEWGDIKATGHSIEVRIISIVRIKNGKIFERWENADTMELLNQLGVG